MKAVFVQSANGYLASGPTDDMLWTPSLDKKIFKLLCYAFGGVMVCSRHTYDLLPIKMKEDPNRTYIIAEGEGNNSLENLNKLYPHAVLVGGPTFLKAAYNAKVIDEMIVTTVGTYIKGTQYYLNPFKKLLENHPFERSINFKLDNMKIQIYIPFNCNRNLYI